MSLLDWIFGKKKEVVESAATTRDLLDNVEVAPTVYFPKALANHWGEIAKWKVNYIKIEAIPSVPSSVDQSSFGYYPRLPQHFPYPVDSNGKYMYPLAQINCNELPPLEGYPRNGHLQFYISTNDIYGCNFDKPDEQSNFRVLYFTNDDVRVFRTDFSFLDETMNSQYKPVNKPHTLSFSLKDEYFGMADARFEEESMQELDKMIDKYPSVAKDLEDYVWDNFESNGHKMGGYAFFTQSDPRHELNEEFILLLQIDSDKEIIWGDVGVANFFIRPGDLANLDFSKVIYHWDCT